MDYYALLGETRRPWLDLETLKDKFHALTASHHPDVATDSHIDFTQLTAAYQTLRDPVTRLRHFLELEDPDALTSQPEVPASLIDLFMVIGETRMRVDEFLKREKQAISPLTRALHAEEKHSLTEELTQQLSTVKEARAAFLQWLRDTPDPSQLGDCYRCLSFLARWSEQIDQCLLKLGV